MNQKVYLYIPFLVVGMITLAGCSHSKEAAVTEEKDGESVAVQEEETETVQEEPVEEIEDTGEAAAIPRVAVSNQAIKNNTVMIDTVITAVSSWVVVHSDVGGKPGDVVGYAAVALGESTNVVVTIDGAKSTPTLHAMLHDDAGAASEYEFPGADVPTLVDDAIVVTSFTATSVPTNPTPTGTGTGTGTQGAQTSTLKEFTIIARQWKFEPSTITVKKGDTVKMTVKSADVAHGISIPEFGVNRTVEAGETVNFEFIASKRGTFSMTCSVYCGPGHKDMKGTLIVEE